MGNSFLPFVGSKFMDLIKSGTDRVAEEIVQAFTNKISDYLDIEFERNSKTKTILHRHAPIELEKFYQPLFIKSGVKNWARGMKSSKSKRISTTDIEELFSKGNCVTIIGTAGSGKSTLVKYLFVNAIESEYKIPIKIELRYLNDYDKDLLTYIIEEIIKYSRMAKDDKVVDRMLASGAFVIFFDGYDEISSIKKATITNDICKITKKYNNNDYILTSRPFVNVDLLEGFINYQVCELCDAEIESFVKKQFNGSEQELANKIIQTIKDDSSKVYRSFLSNPLLLSMFIITYSYNSDIPQKQSDYCNQVFNALYSSHDAQSKLGFVRERMTKLNKENFEEILKGFSFTSYFEQKFSFTLTYFENQLNILKNELHLSFSNEDFLKDMEVAIGILAQDGLEITFPHRSLQEYFAAWYVATVPNSIEISMYVFLFSYFENSCLDDPHGNSFNFFSLLYEIDTDRFNKLLVIPLLYKIKEKREKAVEARSAHAINEELVLECFNLLCGVSSYVNSTMEHFFVRHANSFREKKVLLNNELRGYCSNPIELHAEVIRLWVNKYVFPFLKAYDKIDDIIKGIEKSIADSESSVQERIRLLSAQKHRNNLKLG